MNTNSRILRLITYIYIYLPVFIFLIGYTKIWIWIVTVPVCIFSLFKLFMDYDEGETCHITIKWGTVIIVSAIIILFCLYIGYGGLLLQAGDWAKHNAVLHDLTERSWPVYYTDHEKSMLTYYLGQYIFPACIGKLAIFFTQNVDNGFTAASITMAVWGIIGISLVYYNLVRVTYSDTIFKQFRCAFILLFFSGALPLAQLVTSGLYGDNMYSQGSLHWLLYNGLSMQYRSNTVMLRWVFPQVIVSWLITILFLELKNEYKYYVVLFAPILIYGTFSIIMFAIMAVGYVAYCLIISNDRKIVVKEVLSINNISCMLTLGVVLILFFAGYLQVDKPEFMSLKCQITKSSDITGIIVFDLFMFGIYAICIYKEQKDNMLFYLCVMLLSFIPCFRMGLFNDLVMCASIPGLFMVMIWVIQTINKEQDSKEFGIRVGVISLMLLIGAWYPFVEIKNNINTFVENGISGPADYYGSLSNYSDRNSDEQQDLVYNYFTYDLDGKLFYEYIAKNKTK